MYNRLTATTTTGVVVYAVIRNTSGQVWNGTTFESYLAANYTTYAVTLTEQGATGTYFASIPSGITQAGIYYYTVERRVGGSPAVADPAVFDGQFAVGLGLPAVDSSYRVDVGEILGNPYTDAGGGYISGPPMLQETIGFSSKTKAFVLADPAPTASRAYYEVDIVGWYAAAGDIVFVEGSRKYLTVTGSGQDGSVQYFDYRSVDGYLAQADDVIYVLPPGSVGVAEDVAAIKATAQAQKAK